MAKKATKPIESQHLLDFDNPLVKWPPNDRFPLNLRELQRNVINEIISDINDSDEYLVVTGFTSLAHIIDFFGEKVDFNKLKKVRIVLGFAPEIRRRKTWGKVDLTKEIKDFWVDQDYSLLHGGSVIRLIELIKADRVEFKFSDRLHAKIYVGKTHVILGSANFSKNGLTFQQEANIRIENSDTNPTDKQRYDEIALIANNFYEEARDFKNEIIDLLKELLSIVKWEEAVARAISELIDKNWLKDLPELYNKLNSISLWPSQRMGLGQALYILQTQGCVLIADPTGSGKTKLISTLQLALFHWLWETGRKNTSYTLTICPPLVKETWSQEFLNIKFSQNSQVSMGLLSHTRNLSHGNVIRQIKAANILVIDEAHNYLNLHSKRSDSVAEHTSDYIILATATPINKKSKDLLRLIDLLGVDNLNDKELEQFKNLKRLKSIKKPSDIGILKDYIKKFIVRRTKIQLNRLIEQEPKAYINRQGKECKFPEPKDLTYPTGETTSDITIANKINILAKELNGIIYLQDLSRPDFEFDYTDDWYVENRLKAAKALSVFNIQAKLRSSRAALLEHIEGTKAALDHFKFTTSKVSSGNIVNSLQKHILKLPKTEFEDKFLPDWLKSNNYELYKEFCEKEIATYKQIATLVKSLSDHREQTKAQLIVDLFKKHDLLLAFDSTIISLDYINKILKEKKAHIESHVVTGNTSKAVVLKKFELGSNAKNVIALCSDSMSEGVNLQQASALIFLDMPSVLRIAEQRIGRIDRLDSLHKTIEIYWPNDSDEFALKTDLKLLRTSIDTENLIGSNFNIPAEILEKLLEHIVKPGEMIEALKEAEKDDYLWEGIQDAFTPVHDLYDGKNPLIKKEDYLYYRDVEASVKVKLSIGQSDQPWLFLALKGDKNMSPRWYFIDSDSRIHLELSDICTLLRNGIANVNKWEEKWTDKTKSHLNAYMSLLQENEINILPNKRKRALEVAKYILEKQLKSETDKIRKKLLVDVLILFRPTSMEDEYSLDYYNFAQQWLDILNPYLYDKRKATKSKKLVISLNNLKKDHRTIELSVNTLQRLVDYAPYTKQVWRRVAACIIGIPKLT